jgi:hypothetical protein
VVSFKPRFLYPEGKSLGTQLIGNWIGPGVVWTLWDREFFFLPGIELRRPAGSLPLYRLSYIGLQITLQMLFPGGDGVGGLLSC